MSDDNLPDEPPSLTDLKRTDDQVLRGHARIAARFAARFAGDFHHVHGLGWFAWDGKRWAAANKGEPTQALLLLIREAWQEALADKELGSDVRASQSASGLRGVLAIASQLETFALVAADLDADPYLLNLENGTLDLHDFVLKPHDPADRITRLARASWEPGGQSPLWDSVMARILPDPEVRGFLQRYVGLSLLGKVIDHKLLILIGEGRNGKGTFYQAVNRTLGDYAKVAEPDLFMQKVGAHPTGQMDLLGARLVVTSETDQGRRLASAVVKRLTGGDPIKARYMGKDFVEFDPSHTAMMVTNHLPQVSGDDPALWARVRVVNFAVRIPDHEQIKDLDDQLSLEANGILMWAARGWWDYVQRGHDLAEPGSVLEATAQYRIDSDYIGEFVDECCVIEDGAKTQKGALHQRFNGWAATQPGVPQLSMKDFVREMNRHGFESVTGTGGSKCLLGLKVDVGAF